MTDFFINNYSDISNPFNNVEHFDENIFKHARAIIQSCPHHQETPLFEATQLAKKFNIDKIFLKDESKRFGLNSFKAIGGVYAVLYKALQHLEQKTGQVLSFDEVFDYKHAHSLKNLNFATASAGNHGIAVAAGARLIGAKATVLLPKSTPQFFVNKLKALNAQLEVIEQNYDDCLELIKEKSKEHNWLIITDRVDNEFIEIPNRIMHGYMLIADEIEQQKSFSGLTHIFLQAGVGAFASAIATYIRYAGYSDIKIIVVEPTSAPCLLQSVQSNRLLDTGTSASILGRLNCGIPSLHAFNTLKKISDAFISIDDKQAVKAQEQLSTLLNTSACGSAGFAGFTKIMQTQSFRDRIQLTNNSQILVINTEGNISQ